LPVSTYKIWAIGNPVGMGATAPLHVGVAGVAKTNGPHHPTVVANELVCNKLASALLLPTPPGFVIEHNGAAYYVSLNFNLAGQNLPPADPAAIVAAHPELAWGIVLFDAWILNDDRSPNNIAFDATTSAVQIFDHSHALFTKNAQTRTQHAALLGIGGHCLAPRMITLNGFDRWCGRFAALSEDYVRTVVTSAVDPRFNVSLADANAYADWLVDRQGRLRDLVRGNRAVFQGIPAGTWDPPAAAPAGPGAPGAP
jgi:hypothetical protein